MKKLFSTLFLALLLLVGSASALQIPWVYPLYPFTDYVTFDKWLKVKELSSAPTHKSGYGMIYVLSSNSHLYYKTDTGSTTDLAVAAAGTTTSVKENNVQVGDSDILTLDFLGDDFVITETPDTEINIAIDYANGQAATTGTKGFLTGTDWDTFDGKQAADTALTNLSTVAANADRYLRVTGTDAFDERTYANVLSDIGAQATDTALTALSTVAANADRYLRVTGTDAFDERTYANVLSDIGAQASDADLSTLAVPTAWRVFYSDGSSVITELALGANGKYLMTNGASAAPTWEDPSVGGTFYDEGAEGGAFTIDWSNGAFQKVTITGVALDITFTEPASPGNYLLMIVQGDGDDTLDWEHEVSPKWPGDVEPTLSTGSGDVDFVGFFFDGSTTYYGLFNGNFY